MSNLAVQFRKPAQVDEMYEITVKGHLDEDWAEWFGDLVISHTEQGETILAGPIPDQPALLGLLNRLLELSLKLVSVKRV